MKGSTRKILITVGVLIVFVIVCALLNLKPVKNFSEKYKGVDLNKDVEGTVREGTYTKYLSAHEDAGYPAKSVEVDLFAYTEGEGVEVYENYEGEGKVLYTDTKSTVSWKINVPETGFYNIYIEYLTVKSRGVAIERSFYINGELPFDDAGNITFSRIWTDASEPKVDNQGNEFRPRQVEVYAWQSAYFKDDMGYIVEPYQFYFQAGENTITIKGVNEPMVLRKLVLDAVDAPYTYADYLADNADKEVSDVKLKFVQVVQGEDSTIRSEPSLYAKYDKSAPNTQPYSVTNTILNYIGGETWCNSGQWIEWEFTVPEDGFYNITVKGRQNYSRGSVSSRTVYIDGKIPFDEMKEISFEYDNDWNSLTLADKDGKPYKFYLTAGTHTIRLEATLGGSGIILEELEDSIYRLNQIYRRILVYTGASPDKYRDYNIDKVYPEVMEAMDLESKRLYKIVDDMVAYTGQKADKIATAQTLAQQLERFTKKPNKITEEFTTFKDNITALGTAVLNMSQTKLDIDYLVITSTDTKPKKDKANIFTKMWHEIKAFAATFFVDYNAVGDVYAEENDVVTVWILSGRDQGAILKSMVDDTFTPDTGIKVNVEIVAADALLSAVMAGRGPDVVLSVGSDQPVNYALRGAAEDITQFEDYKEVLSNYTESSYEQYCLDGAIYGIPETQTFNVMFYRKDILEELGLTIPQTWQDLIEMFPTIQGNNMSIGIPSAAGSSTSANASTSVASNAPDLSLYFSLLFQQGGDLYNEAGTKAIVDNEAGVKAMDVYTRFFTDYGIPVFFDFISRFRTGEMPIGIASYQTYNTLMVSAPEIRGLWDFTLIPGTEKVDEEGNTYIDRSDFITGNATMMIASEDKEAKQRAWEFMKWWASTDTQVRFGREIEALLGSSARYATANINAFSQLAWSADDIETLTEQWNQTVGIREIPGGYYTGRHITNAMRKVINSHEDPRETIIDYTITINNEIAKKRSEFGLPLK
ncbi:MAG: ABC-type glycerol-3-phosphate transport system, substrate-binding protein [Lachnoclostridium sp.]|jgi:ABC-type glycerol-3-phosphate transport system substrate-binding protein